jgi:hypothetical protein
MLLTVLIQRNHLAVKSPLLMLTGGSGQMERDER